MTKRNDALDRFRGAHEGGRCWVVGNGPSLNKTDMDLVAASGYPSFGMNCVALLYPRTKWRPTYYVYTSVAVASAIERPVWLPQVRRAMDCPATDSFVWGRFKRAIEGGGWTASPTRVHWLDAVTERGLKSAEDCFSLDAGGRLDKTGSTLHVALQIAVWMGFKEIVLLGADLSYRPTDGVRPDTNHFSPDYKVKVPTPDTCMTTIRAGHRHAAKRLAQAGVRIANASVETTLDTYPLVEYWPIARGGPVPEEDEKTERVKRLRAAMPEYWSEHNG